MDSLQISSAQRLIAFIQKTFGTRLGKDETVGLSTPLFSSRLVDSMGMIELLVFLERELGVTLELTMEEAARLDTVERFVQRIEQLQRSRAAQS